MLEAYRMIRRRGSIPTSPCQSLVIPFRATGIAVYLEDKATSESDSEDWRSEFSIRFSLFYSHV